MVMHSNKRVSTESLWALSNAVDSENGEIINLFVDNDLIKCLSKYLENKYKRNIYHEWQNRLLNVVLEFMDNILINDNKNDQKYAKQFKKFGGYNFILYLLSNKEISESIYWKAKQMRNDYFDCLSPDICYLVSI